MFSPSAQNFHAKIALLDFLDSYQFWNPIYHHCINAILLEKEQLNYYSEPCWQSVVIFFKCFFKLCVSLLYLLDFLPIEIFFSVMDLISTLQITSRCLECFSYVISHNVSFQFVLQDWNLIFQIKQFISKMTAVDNMAL